MNLNSKLAREILKNAEEHRLAAPAYIGINKNPKKNTYGEFHIYPEESPCHPVARLLVSKTPPRMYSGKDPLGGCCSFNVPAVLGLETDIAILNDLLAKHPLAEFVACHHSGPSKRSWALCFRTDNECVRFSSLSGFDSLKLRRFGRFAWIKTDYKDRIE